MNHCTLGLSTIVVGPLKPHFFVCFIPNLCWVHGSGSTSGNVDLDPGSKENLDKLAYK